MKTGARALVLMELVSYIQSSMTMWYLEMKKKIEKLKKCWCWRMLWNSRTYGKQQVYTKPLSPHNQVHMNRDIWLLVTYWPNEFEMSLLQMQEVRPPPMIKEIHGPYYEKKIRKKSTFNPTRGLLHRPFQRPSVDISNCNSVKSGWPTSNSQHNPQQFHDWNR